ncbi:MAG: site-specific integrase [Desulfobacterales bacterium]|nr:site-specific integrase [Desulfobacterales bacterium]
MNFLKDRDAKKLLSAAKRLKAQTIIHILLCTGIRSGELAALNVEDVDYDSKQLYIVDSKKKKRFAVPVDSKTLGLIKRYVHSRSEGPLFISQMTRKRLTDQGVCKTVRKAAARAGIKHKYNVTPRTLRHTFAINWLRAGGNIESLRRILRHKTLLSTQVYLDFDQSLVRREYERIFEGVERSTLVPEKAAQKQEYIS